MTNVHLKQEADRFKVFSFIFKFMINGSLLWVGRHCFSFILFVSFLSNLNISWSYLISYNYLNSSSIFHSFIDTFLSSGIILFISSLSITTISPSSPKTTVKTTHTLFLSKVHPSIILLYICAPLFLIALSLAVPVDIYKIKLFLS